MSEPEPVEFSASDGYRLSGLLLRSPSPRGAIVVNAATGFPREFYLRFARHAAERGYHVLVYDYRGIGASRRLPLRREPARMSDWGRLDMPAALDWLTRAFPGVPRYTLGHSIGGQLLGMVPNHALASAHVLVAASTGYWRWELAPFRWFALVFWKLWGPFALALWGYIPARIVWSGDALPRNVYLEWRKWCLRPEHFAPDLSGELAPAYYGEVRAPMLSVAFEDDPIATRRTVPALLAYFARAPIEQRWFAPRDLGVKTIAHQGFFSPRFRDSLWSAALDWLDARSEGVR